MRTEHAGLRKKQPNVRSCVRSLRVLVCVSQPLMSTPAPDADIGTGTGLDVDTSTDTPVTSTKDTATATATATATLDDETRITTTTMRQPAIISATAHAKIVLHAARYPHAPIIGLLLAQQTSKKETYVRAWDVCGCVDVDLIGVLGNACMNDGGRDGWMHVCFCCRAVHAGCVSVHIPMHAMDVCSQCEYYVCMHAMYACMRMYVCDVCTFMCVRCCACGGLVHHGMLSSHVSCAH